MTPIFLKLIVISIFAATLISQNSCFLFDNRSNLRGEAEFYEIQKLSYSDVAERSELFNSYPVEKQIDIYLFSMAKGHVGVLYYRGYLMTGGEGKIKGLVEVIESEHFPSVKHELISVIWEIDRNCNCVANDLAIIERLKRAEPFPAPSDDRGDWLSKKGYSWVLFELQRNSQDKKDNVDIQNLPNPYSNSNMNLAR